MADIAFGGSQTGQLVATNDAATGIIALGTTTAGFLGTKDTFVGSSAGGGANNASNSVYLGYLAGYNGVGDSSVVIGYNAAPLSVQSGGSGNSVIIGADCLPNASSVTTSVVLGSNNGTGAANVQRSSMIGSVSVQTSSCDEVVAVGSRLGVQTPATRVTVVGQDLTAGGTNTICIGYNNTVASTTVSNIAIGTGISVAGTPYNTVLGSGVAIDASSNNNTVVGAGITLAGVSNTTCIDAALYPGGTVASETVYLGGCLSWNKTTGNLALTATGSATLTVTGARVLAASSTALSLFNGAASVSSAGVITAASIVASLSGNVSGTAANVTATSNSTLTTLSALALPTSQLTGTLAIANGGTGQVSASAALTALTGSQTAGYYVRSNGTAAALSAIQAADVPTLNQNTTGTAANVTATSNSTLVTLSALVLPTSQLSGAISATNVTATSNSTLVTLSALSLPTSQLTGTLAIAHGGTGQATAAAALTALTGSQTAGYYVRSDGTAAALSAIQAADVPTLNQNTTGTASNVTATSNSTLVTLSALALPTSQLTGTISATNVTATSNSTLVTLSALALPTSQLTGTLAIAHGGTGQATAAAALTALTGTQTAGRYVRSDGTNAALSAILAADVPGVASTAALSCASVTTSGSIALSKALSTWTASVTNVVDGPISFTSTAGTVVAMTDVYSSTDAPGCAYCVVDAGSAALIAGNLVAATGNLSSYGGVTTASVAAAIPTVTLLTASGDATTCIGVVAAPATAKTSRTVYFGSLTMTTTVTETRAIVNTSGFGAVLVNADGGNVAVGSLLTLSTSTDGVAMVQTGTAVTSATIGKATQALTTSSTPALVACKYMF